jgi:protein SCO1/2
MINPLRPLFVGLSLVGLPLLLALSAFAAAAEFGEYSHDEALAHSQAAIGRQLQGIELLRPDGSAVSLSEYRGKPLVISMIFSSCHHVCPTTTQYLRQVIAKARSALGEDSFQVLSIGFDTVNDSPERMAQFRASTGISDERWEFLAGDPAGMAALAEHLGFIYYPSPRGFDHLVQASVVDPEGVIYRQVYGMSFPTPVLVEPLKQLVFGQPEAPSAVDYLSNRIRLFCTVYDPATDTYHVDISVFIGTFVGIMVSILFGRVLFKEWRRSIEAGR